MLEHQRDTSAGKRIVKTSGGSTRQSYVAWGPTYQVLYPAVTVGRLAPLASIADIITSLCHSSGLCWFVLLHMADGQMLLLESDTLCHGGKGSPLSAQC